MKRPREAQMTSNISPAHDKAGIVTPFTSSHRKSEKKNVCGKFWNTAFVVCVYV